jgi:hypothetical protein
MAVASASSFSPALSGPVHPQPLVRRLRSETAYAAPGPTDRPPRSWRAVQLINSPGAPLQHLAAAGDSALTIEVAQSHSRDSGSRLTAGLIVRRPVPSQFRWQASMLECTSPPPRSNILLSTTNGVGRSVNLKGIIVDSSTSARLGRPSDFIRVHSQPCPSATDSDSFGKPHCRRIRSQSNRIRRMLHHSPMVSKQTSRPRSKTLKTPSSPPIFLPEVRH